MPNKAEMVQKLIVLTVLGDNQTHHPQHTMTNYHPLDPISYELILNKVQHRHQ